MKDFSKTTQRIAQFVSDVIPFPISVTDENGYIIGATDPSRIGKLHPDTQKIIETKSFVSYEIEDAAKIANVHPGISAPLVFNDEIIGIIGIIGSPKKVQPYAKLIKQYVEFVWQENHLQQIDQLENKMYEIYLQYILQVDNPDENRIIEYSQALQIEPYQPMMCVAIEIENFIMHELSTTSLSLSRQNSKELILKKIQKHFISEKILNLSLFNAETIIVIFSFETIDLYQNFIASFKSNSKKLMKELNAFSGYHTKIASGKLVDYIGDLKLSFEEATSLLNFSKDGLFKDNVLSMSDWHVASALLLKKVDRGFLLRIAKDYKHLFNDTQFSELSKSFIGYCENNMNISQASKALYIHRNTLIYRLDKIEQLFQIDIKNFQQCILLYFILSTNTIDSFQEKT